MPEDTTALAETVRAEAADAYRVGAEMCVIRTVDALALVAALDETTRERDEWKAAFGIEAARFDPESAREYVRELVRIGAAAEAALETAHHAIHEIAVSLIYTPCPACGLPDPERYAVDCESLCGKEESR